MLPLGIAESFLMLHCSVASAIRVTDREYWWLARGAASAPARLISRFSRVRGPVLQVGEHALDEEMR